MESDGFDPGGSVAGRAEGRVSVRLDVMGQLHAQIVDRRTPVTIREISRYGFSTETIVPFDGGSRHEFLFSLNGGVTALRLAAVCMHCTRVSRPSGLAIYTAGFEFLRPDEWTAVAIAALVDQVAVLVE